MNLKSILCVCLAAVTLTLGNQTQDGVQSNGDASYEFGYDIHNPLANDIKSHHEIRDGKNVLGFYTFREADGTIRVVKYKVTPDTGFEAVVEKLQPDPISGNSIDGQDASPSSHGAPEAVNEQTGGQRRQYVAGNAESLYDVTANRNLQNKVPEPQHAPAQYYINKNPPVQDQRRINIQQPQHHPNGKYQNPYIIRKNTRIRSDQQLQLPTVNSRSQNVLYPIQNNHDQRLVQEARYVDVPRGRQRNAYIGQRQTDQGQLQLQERAQPRIQQGHMNQYITFPQGQVQQYANNLVQPNPYGSGKIVYIDGVAYIDDIGLYSDPPGQNVQNVQLYPPGQIQSPQYQVVENPENDANDEAATNTEDAEETEVEEDKDEYEEEDDEDEDDDDNADYEEEEESDDEETDATDFYEENEQLINEQKKKYNKLKKAYEHDDEETNPKEQEAEEPEQ